MQQTKKTDPILQLGILIVLFFGSVAFSTLLYYLIAKFFLGINNPLQYAQSGNAADSTAIVLFANGMISSIGCFLLPAVLFALIVSKNIKSYLHLDKLFTFKEWGIATLIVISSTMVISLLVTLNKAIPLPESLYSLRESGAAAEKLIDSFFTQMSISRFILLSFFIALLPALSEEFFFRGVVLRIFSEFKSGIITAIILSSVFFAIFHLSFDNFLGIVFMGSVLACLYWFTQNLWVSIWAHFLNNFSIVIMKSLYATQRTQTDWSSVETVPVWMSIVGIIFTAAGFYFLYKNRTIATISQDEIL